MLTSQINEAKRNILLDYYQYQVAPIASKTYNEVYQYLLIDAQSAPQTPTTRVMEAINSVLLYIDLVLMNMIEGHNVRLNEKALEEWEGVLKDYKLWQICRKMQSYPENYLNITSRSNKSEAFKRFESMLMQGSHDEDTIKMLVDEYFKGFTESSDIEFISGYINGNNPKQDRYYFIGRTRSRPYKYYWRSLEFNSESQMWSEWKEMIVPLECAVYNTTRLAYFNNRLWVTWINIQDKKEIEDGKITEKEMKSMKEVSLNIAYKEKDDSWSMPKVLLKMDVTKKDWDLPALGEQNRKTDLLTSATFVIKRDSKEYLFVGVVSDNQEKASGDNKDLKYNSNNMEVIIDENLFVYRDQGYYNSTIEYYEFVIHLYESFNLGDEVKKYTKKEKESLEKQLQVVKMVLEATESAGNNSSSKSIYTRFRLPKGLQHPIKLKLDVSSVKSEKKLPVGTNEKDLTDLFSIEKGNIEILNSEKAKLTARLTLQAFKAYRIEIKEIDQQGVPTQRTRTLLIHNRSDQEQQYRSLYISPLPEGAANLSGTLYDSEFDNVDNIQLLNIPTLGKGWEITISTSNGVTVQANIDNYSEVQEFQHVIKSSDEECQQSNEKCKIQKLRELNGNETIEFEFDILNSNTFLHELVIKEGNISLKSQKKVEIRFGEIDNSGERKDIIIKSTENGDDRVEYLDFGKLWGEELDNKIILNTKIVKELVRILEKDGFDKLLSYETQNSSDLSLPGENERKIDFYGVNGLYLWELFFYLPWAVAYQMQTQNKYDDSRRWLYYIFDPRDADEKNEKLKYWKTRPLVEKGNSENMVGKDVCDPYVIAMKNPIHFRKTIFLFYVNNIVEQGKSVYEADDLNKALLYFVQASSFLGNQPEIKTISRWTSIKLGEILSSNNLPYIMTNLPIKATKTKPRLAISATSDSNLFKLPFNTELLRYWKEIQVYLDKIHLGIRSDGSIAGRFGGGSRLALGGASPQGSQHSGVTIIYTFTSLYSYSKELVDDLINYFDDLLSILQSEEDAHLEEYQAKYLIDNLYTHLKASKSKAIEAAELTKYAIGMDIAIGIAKAIASTALLVFDVSSFTSVNKELNMADKLNKELEDKAAEDKAAEDKAAENKVAEDKAVEDKAAKNKRSLGRKGLEGAKHFLQKILLFSRNASEGDRHAVDLVIKSLNKGKSFASASREGLAASEASSKTSSAATDPVPSHFGTSSGGRKNIGSGALSSVGEATTYKKDAAQRIYDTTKDKFASIRHLIEDGRDLAIGVLEAVKFGLELTAHNKIIEVLEAEKNLVVEEEKRDKYIMKYLTSERTTKECLYKWMREKIQCLCKSLFKEVHDLCKEAEKSFKIQSSDNNKIPFIRECKEYMGVKDNSQKSMKLGNLNILAGKELKADLLRMYMRFTHIHRRKLEVVQEFKLSELLKDKYQDWLETLKSNGKLEFSFKEIMFSKLFPRHFDRQIRIIELLVLYKKEHWGDDKEQPHENFLMTLEQTSNYSLLPSSFDIMGKAQDPDWKAAEALLRDNISTLDSDTIKHISTNVNIGYPSKIVYSYTKAPDFTASLSEGSPGLFSLSFFNKLENSRVLPFERTGIHSDWIITFPSHDSGEQQEKIAKVEDIMIAIQYQAREGTEEFGNKVTEIIKNIEASRIRSDLSAQVTNNSN